MKNVLKVTVFCAFLLIGVTLVAPKPAHAIILDRLFENAPPGPHCLFMDCNNTNNSQPSVVNNVVNSNNSNSFNNNTAPITGTVNYQSGTSGRATINQTTPYASVQTTPYVAPAQSSSNTNYNYNYNSGGGTNYVQTPVYTQPNYYYTQPNYYAQPNYYYTQPQSVPTYYYQPTNYTTPYQYPVYTQPQPTYYQPVSYVQGIQIACGADTATARVGVPVTWSAEALYNNSAIGFAYSWSGTDGLYGYQSSAIMTYYTTGTKSAIVTVTAPNGETQSKVCSNTVSVKSTAAAPVKKIAQAPKPSPIPPQIVYVPAPQPPMTAASLFSLGNVPWGWIGILIILVLIGMILYLMFNHKKI
jgi:hypothetical protein